MKKSFAQVLVVGLVCGLALGAFVLTDTANAKSSYLDGNTGVNTTCNSNYGCGLCHVDPKGGGTLTSDGQAYRSSGYDACFFCPDVCNPPPACDPAETSCTDGIDNDCNSKTDCDDSACTNDPACIQTGNCALFDGDRAGCNSLANCNYVGKTKTCEDVNAPPTDCSAFNNITDCKSNGCRWSRKDSLCK